MDQKAIDDWVKQQLATRPPLTAEQGDLIHRVFNGDKIPRHPWRPTLVNVHYDQRGDVLFVGDVCTSLLRHVSQRYVARVEKLPERDAVQLKRTGSAIFNVSGETKRAVPYLVEQGDYAWLMPVVHRWPDFTPTPQMLPDGQGFTKPPTYTSRNP